MDNMTARMSAFLRDWHYRNNETHVFRDEAAGQMLTEAERKEMENSLYAGGVVLPAGFSWEPSGDAAGHRGWGAGPAGAGTERLL